VLTSSDLEQQRKLETRIFHGRVRSIHLLLKLKTLLQALKMHATTLLAPFELRPCQCRRPVMKYRTAVKRHTWVPKEQMLRNTRDASSKVYQTKAKVYQDLKRKRKSSKIETFFSSVKQPSIVKKLSICKRLIMKNLNGRPPILSILSE
jgi:hypothetical protein